MQDEGRKILDEAYKGLENEVPDRVCRIIRWLRDPKARWIRLPVGGLLVLSSAFWFLPVIGIEFLPLGLLLIAEDVPFLRKPIGLLLIWCERKWLRLKKWWSAREI